MLSLELVSTLSVETLESRQWRVPLSSIHSNPGALWFKNGNLSDVHENPTCDEQCHCAAFRSAVARVWRGTPVRLLKNHTIPSWVSRDGVCLLMQNNRMISSPLGITQNEKTNKQTKKARDSQEKKQDLPLGEANSPQTRNPLCLFTASYRPGKAGSWQHDQALKYGGTRCNPWDAPGQSEGRGYDPQWSFTPTYTPVINPLNEQFPTTLCEFEIKRRAGDQLTSPARSQENQEERSPSFGNWLVTT